MKHSLTRQKKDFKFQTIVTKLTSDVFMILLIKVLFFLQLLEQLITI